MPRFVTLSGCSGGGKSTLLAELARRGFATVDEPGRRIVAEEQAGDGAALPWVDLAAFARRAVAMARADRAVAAERDGVVFFDRGLIDAAVALEHAAGVPLAETLGPRDPRDILVFLAPPWPEIHRRDDARRHGLDEARAEYARLAAAYPALGHRVSLLPLISVAARADFVLAAIGGG